MSQQTTTKQNKLFDLLLSQGFDPWKNTNFIKEYSDALLDEICDRVFFNLPISLKNYQGEVSERHGHGYVYPDGVIFDSSSQEFEVIETVD